MHAALLIIAASIVLARTTAYSDDTETTTPVQELGTIVYFVPTRHPDADMGTHGHGFVAFVLQKTDENNIKPTFIAHSAVEFVAAYERLPRNLQQCGIWLTLQEGDPYSPDEKAMLEELKALCSKRKLPLSIHTGREDKGWQRFSDTSPEGSNRALEHNRWPLC